jgi:hypothetical protein
MRLEPRHFTGGRLLSLHFLDHCSSSTGLQNSQIPEIKQIQVRYKTGLNQFQGLLCGYFGTVVIFVIIVCMVTLVIKVIMVMVVVVMVFMVIMAIMIIMVIMVIMVVLVTLVIMVIIVIMVLCFFCVFLYGPSTYTDL